jgi:hypothetical protein
MPGDIVGRIGGTSAGNAMCSIPGWLVFRRIVDIPFEVCAAALESWSRPEGHDGELLIGRSVLRGPIEHDRDSETCRVEVRLARGPLRSLLRMRLDVDRWSSSPSSTALELIPSARVRPAASYFRAGHLFLDRLTHRLRLEREIPYRSTPVGADHCSALRPEGRRRGAEGRQMDPATLAGYHAKKASGPASGRLSLGTRESRSGPA